MSIIARNERMGTIFAWFKIHAIFKNPRNNCFNCARPILFFIPLQIKTNGTKKRIFNPDDKETNQFAYAHLMVAFVCARLLNPTKKEHVRFDRSAIMGGIEKNLVILNCRKTKVKLIFYVPWITKLEIKKCQQKIERQSSRHQSCNDERFYELLCFGD